MFQLNVSSRKKNNGNATLHKQTNKKCMDLFKKPFDSTPLMCIRIIVHMFEKSTSLEMQQYKWQKKKTCIVYRKLNNKQHMKFIFSGCMLLFCVSFISMLKIKSMVYGCDVSYCIVLYRIVSTARRIANIVAACTAHENVCKQQMFFVFAIFDSEKQIFLMFMIIHAANPHYDQCQKFRCNTRNLHSLTLSHSILSRIFILNHKTALLPMLLCSVTNFGP